MFAFVYTFYPDTKRYDLREFLDDALWRFVRAMLTSGQARGEARMLTLGSALTWYGMCEERDALKPRFRTAEVRAMYKYVLKGSKKAPTWKILGEVSDTSEAGPRRTAVVSHNAQVGLDLLLNSDVRSGARDIRL